MIKKCPVCPKKFELFTSSHFHIDGTRVVGFCSEKCKTNYVNHSGPVRSVFNFINMAHLLKLGGIVIGIGTIMFLTILIYSGVPIESYGKFKKFKNIQFESEIVFNNSGVKKIQVEKLSDSIYLKMKSLAVLEKVVSRMPENLWEIETNGLMALYGNKKAKQNLLKLLKSKNVVKRRKAAIELVKIGEKSGIMVLRRDIDSKRMPNSASAAFALKKFDDKYAFRHLKQLMGFRQTRFAAAAASLWLGYAPAKKYLLRIATTGKREGDRVRAAFSLAKSGEMSVKPILMAARNGEFKFRSALGLAYLGDRTVIPILKKSLKITGLRVEVAKLLSKFKEYDSIKILKPYLEMDVDSQRLSAASGILILTTKISLKNNIKISMNEINSLFLDYYKNSKLFLVKIISNIRKRVVDYG
jgi:hypothetical protein